MDYNEYFSTRTTPQDQPIPGSDQVPNSAGGYSWAVDDWKRLERFLILGSEGGTYYIGEKELTVENAEAVSRCIDQNGPRVVDTLAAISDEGRAHKNDQALFVLAMCAKLGNQETRRRAYEALPKVARIGTHLFNFVKFVEGFGGWGRGLKRAIQKWYTEKSVSQIAYQAVKYQQREGWSHRDLLRLSHPKTNSGHQTVFRWIVKGMEKDLTPVNEVPEDLRIIWAFERAKEIDVSGDTEAPNGRQVREMVNLITDHRLPHECVSNRFKNEIIIWDAMLKSMGMTAMIRNLGKMTKVGLIHDLSTATDEICNRLTNVDLLKKGRIHPMTILLALTTYRVGRGFRGSLTWDPSRRVLDALDKAFYLSFKTVEPTGKRFCLALDISGSMGQTIDNTHLSARDASAAMALITANVEEKYQMVGFSRDLIKLNISPRQRLDDVVNMISHLPFGATDCSLPMQQALHDRVGFDVFIVYTDSETWCGGIHPVQALREYRDKMGIPAKLIVVAITSNGFSIADPNDAGMLDCVGFDTATPNVISNFIKEPVPTS